MSVRGMSSAKSVQESLVVLAPLAERQMTGPVGDSRRSREQTAYNWVYLVVKRKRF